MGCNDELNAEKKGDLIKEEVLVTLLTDSYLSNRQKERSTCIAAICAREQIVDFITLHMMELYPPLRGFMVEYNEKIYARDKRLFVDVYSVYKSWMSLSNTTHNLAGRDM